MSSSSGHTPSSDRHRVRPPEFGTHAEFGTDTELDTEFARELGTAREFGTASSGQTPS